MNSKQAPLDCLARMQSGHFYHIFNRTNNKEPLFRSAADRRFFLLKYKQYLSPYLHTFAYCLLGNHFHLLVQVKDFEEIWTHVSNLRRIDRTSAQKEFLEAKEDERNVHQTIAWQFNRFFTSYTLRFNKKEKRSGNLFHRPFKRLSISNENHFTYLIFYIHANPVKHRLSNDFENYPWSSYRTFLSDQPTEIAREKVLEWFGGQKAFIEFHRQDFDFESIDKVIIEG